jgi:hypothetical protein
MASDRCDILCLDLENGGGAHLRLRRSEGLVTSRRDRRMIMYSLTNAGCELPASTLGPEAFA